MNLHGLHARAQDWRYWMCLFGIILAVYTAWTTSINRRLSHQGRDALAGLCAIKHDLERRVASGRAFMARHPEGFLGLDPQTIQQSIDDQEATVKALAVIDCPPDPVPVP